ncbi:MAG: VWA domain-containing protein [Actinomycetota bacterium]
MISGIVGFATVLRQHGCEVGAAELIDAARALTLVDLADRPAVRRALQLTITWSSVHPELFDRLFDEWFSGRELAIGAAPDGVGPDGDGDEADPAPVLDAETTEAARIHNDDAIAVENDDDEDADGVAGGRRSPSTAPTPSTADEDGVAVSSPGEPAAVPPGEHESEDDVRRPVAVVELPEAPPDAELELARQVLTDAVDRRRRVEVGSAPRRVAARIQPLTSAERDQLTRQVRRLGRQLDGAPSWRRARHHRGTIDVRRTMRRSVTTGGLPIERRHLGRRHDAARLVVLVDLSLSVRGTARLVLHLVHRMRSLSGSTRTFGFVDSCVPIDGALRAAEPAVAIERVLGLVDVDASSDPGFALRHWWARSHQLVTPRTHVIILGDGRCNGRDPAFDVVERVTARSASTLWVSPEPQGAWVLGRGEMAAYAERVDRAITVRSIDDLDRLVSPARRAEVRPAVRA